jgi:hypothetical protein
MIAYVGRFVTIKSNSKRYFGGYGKIRAFNPYSPTGPDAFWLSAFMERVTLQ